MVRSPCTAVLGVALAIAALAPLRSPAAPAGPNVQATTGAAVKKAIQSYKGKVVIANIWATWCEPCLEEFPELVKLYDAYKEKGVVLVAISLDEPEDRAKVVQFVQKQNATFPVLMRAKGAEHLEKFIEPLDKKWSGAAPTTYVFGRNSKLVGQPLAGRRTYAQLEAALKSALK